MNRNVNLNLTGQVGAEVRREQYEKTIQEVGRGEQGVKSSERET